MPGMGGGKCAGRWGLGRGQVCGSGELGGLESVRVGGAVGGVVETGIVEQQARDPTRRPQSPCELSCCLHALLSC